MKSEIRFKTTNWRLTVTIGFFVTVLVIVLAMMFRFEFSIILISTAGVIVAVGLVVIYNGLRAGRQNRQLRQLEIDRSRQLVRQETYRADRLQFERYVLSFSRNERIIMLPNVAIKIIDAQPVAKTVPVLALPQPEERPDFFEAMTDDKRVYAIIGPQRVGKSYAVMRIADYLASRGLGHNIVIGIKAEAGEWQDCERHIGLDAISAPLAWLISTVDERHKAGTRAPRLNLFLDDWINAVAVAGDLAEEFFLHAATDMLSAGIVPYFILHSDSKADWGTKHGAMLKNNFAKLILSATRMGGKVIPAETRAAILWPGEKTPIPVDLPRGLPQLGSRQACPEPGRRVTRWQVMQQTVAPPGSIPDPLAPDPPIPDETEAGILAPWDAGLTDRREIARRTIGIGGNQYKRIQEILVKFGRV